MNTQEKKRNIDSDVLLESIKTQIEKLKDEYPKIFDIDIESLLKYSDILKTNYSHQSKEMIDNIILNDEQYPDDKAKFLKLIELYDKMMSLVIETIDKMNPIADSLFSNIDKDTSIMDKLKLIVYKRELDGLLIEIKYITELLDEYSFKIGKKKITELDFEKMQFDTSINQAARILEEIESQDPSGKALGINMRNMKPTERAMFNYVIKNRPRKITVVKNNITTP